MVVGALVRLPIWWMFRSRLMSNSELDAFARLHFRGKNLLFTLCVGSTLLPTTVTLILLYIMWTRGLHLANTYRPLIAPQFCGGVEFNIFLVRQSLRTIPCELDEAATIDGASHFRILVSIIIPSMLFVILWNDLLRQITYINSHDKSTMALGLSQFKGSLGSDWSKIMCASCMSFVPGIVFYLIGQRYFVEGIVVTGLKS